MGQSHWCHLVMATRSATLNRIPKALNDNCRWEPFSYGLKAVAKHYRLRQTAIPPAVGERLQPRSGLATPPRLAASG